MSSNERSLSTQLAERSVNSAQWHTLSKCLYPGAAASSVLLVIDYCNVRGLDPMKKPCHIVPMKVNGQMTDVVLPGIYELRTTAQRTGQYLGHSTPEYGPDNEYLGVKAPAWCSLIVYRWNPAAKVRAEYPVKVYFAEACGTRWDKGKDVVNSRWQKAPRQMLTKCAEAAALREAFPDEIGGEMSAEEMDGHTGYEAPPMVRTETLESVAERNRQRQQAGNGTIIEGEVVPPKGDDVAPPEQEAVQFTATEVRAKIEGAKTKDQLDDAVAIISALPTTDRRDLRALAVKRYQEFV